MNGSYRRDDSDAPQRAGARRRRGSRPRRACARRSAAVRIDVTQGNVQPLPIALPDFVGGTPADSEMARNVTGVITNNLRRSGLFAPIDPAAFIEQIKNPDT